VPATNAAEPTPRTQPYSTPVFCRGLAPDVAIRVAHDGGLPLRIAAKVPRAENRYFKETIKPLLDQNNVEFVGEVNDRQKQSFLGNAAALLFPIDWPEPFGLVMIEAMACGTPVIAWSRGSVPEVVEDGVTSFIVETESEAVAAIGLIHRLDRRRIRNDSSSASPHAEWRKRTSIAIGC
jgi:glycosyltransferase involved in cell wall biosynthesis